MTAYRSGTGAGYRGGVAVAEVVRSGFAESRHHGSVAIVDTTGRLIASVGDPQGAILPRSANKAMQAVAMLRCGLRVTEPADLALVAASHWAEPMHVQRVRAMLRTGGLNETQLHCPSDLPLSDAARTDVLRSGGVASKVYMNCSGKHTGMLLTCLAAGWPLDSYVDVSHPLQLACGEAVEELADERVLAVAVDGCGAPAMALSLAGLARSYAALVHAPAGSPQRTVADAMRAHPELVSGTGADDARLMTTVSGALSKVGAEGVMAVGVPGLGGIAVKIDDGAMRARMPVLVAALRMLGVDESALGDLADAPILGGGVPVGAVRALTTGDWDHASYS